MDSHISVRPRALSALALLALALGLAALLTLPRISQDASAASSKRVTVTVKCKLLRGAKDGGCPGSFSLRGGFRDSGSVRGSSARDDGFGAGFRGVLKGHHGKINASHGGIVVSTFRRRCAYTAGWNLRGDTGRYAGYNGSVDKGSCTSVRVGRRSIVVTSKFVIRLNKR